MNFRKTDGFELAILLAYFPSKKMLRIVTIKVFDVQNDTFALKVCQMISVQVREVCNCGRDAPKNVCRVFVECDDGNLLQLCIMELCPAFKKECSM